MNSERVTKKEHERVAKNIAKEQQRTSAKRSTSAKEQ